MRFIETKIIRNVAAALIAAGMTVSVDYNEGEPELTNSTDVDAIEKAAFEVDECWLLVQPTGDGKYDGFVYLIFGNGNSGLDVISDYSTALQSALQPVLDEIEALDNSNAGFTTCSEFQALGAIVREVIYGDGTDASLQRTIDLCNAAVSRFGIRRLGG